jgi:hypothetical protein
MEVVEVVAAEDEVATKAHNPRSPRRRISST